MVWKIKPNPKKKFFSLTETITQVIKKESFDIKTKKFCQNSWYTNKNCYVNIFNVLQCTSINSTVERKEKGKRKEKEHGNQKYGPVRT